MTVLDNLVESVNVTILDNYIVILDNQVKYSIKKTSECDDTRQRSRECECDDTRQLSVSVTILDNKKTSECDDSRQLSRECECDDARQLIVSVTILDNYIVILDNEVEYSINKTTDSTTESSNKLSTAQSCAEDQILEN